MCSKESRGRRLTLGKITSTTVITVLTSIDRTSPANDVLLRMVNWWFRFVAYGNLTT